MVKLEVVTRPTLRAKSLPKLHDLVFQSWDTAKARVPSSATSTRMHHLGPQRQGISPHLVHVFRKRLDYPELKRAVRDQAERFRSDQHLNRGPNFWNATDPRS